MPRYTVTIGMAQASIGGNEAYISPDLTDDNATAAVQELLRLRRQCLPAACIFTGVRISKAAVLTAPSDNKQKSAFNPPGSYHPFRRDHTLLIYSNGNLVDTEGTKTAGDQARACLQVRLTYDVDRRVIRYFNFVPDGVLQREPNSVNMNAVPAWKTNFDNFWKFLIDNHWAIKARNRGDGFGEFQIKGWVQAATAPFNVGVLVEQSPTPGLEVNDRVAIRGVRRRGTDKTSYNGVYTVRNFVLAYEGSKNAYFLLASETGDPASVKKNGFLRKVGYTYYDIGHYEAIRAGIHKRGKHLGTPSGRRLKRVLLDP